MSDSTHTRFGEYIQTPQGDGYYDLLICTYVRSQTIPTIHISKHPTSYVKSPNLASHKELYNICDYHNQQRSKTLCQKRACYWKILVSLNGTSDFTHK